jgi:hypothetical protein
MQSVPINSEIVFGVLQSDGTVRLDHPSNLPPGPVQITIRAIGHPRERIADQAIEEPFVRPPIELPRIGITRIVHPVNITERLPDLFQIDEVV